MARFPAPNLSVAYTDQTLTGTFVGCHNPDGSLNVSFVNEEDNVGAYALNGSLNVSTDDGLGIRTSGGALRVYEDLGFLTLNQGTGVDAARWADGPAPPGYRWDFITFNGAWVTFNGEPVVALVEN